MTATMPAAVAARTAVLVRAGEVLNRTFVLPVLMFSPTSRCNSRCVSCDWWRSAGTEDLTVDEVARVARTLPRFGTSVVVFTGGEPLLRPDVFCMADLFARHDIRLHLLTSGILLERVAEQVAARFERVTISLDAATPELYRQIRGVAALSILQAGVTKVKGLAPSTPVHARSTLHRLNFREMPRLIACARAMGLDGISFLPADLSSAAFGRSDPGLPKPELGLSRDEVDEFRGVIERVIADRREEIASGFIAEPPGKLRRLAQYYAALLDGVPFPPEGCNAPSISVVLEADGTVRPCFFHDAIGNIRQRPFAEIVLTGLPAFRRTLDVGAHPVCARCVCSIRAGWRNAPWL